MAHNSNKAQRINRYSHFRDLGYTPIPVAPPGARISNAGKCPAIKRGGEWHAVSSEKFVQAKPEVDEIWESWDGSVGLHCHDTGTVGIDIDVLVEGWADEVNRIVAEELGPAPRRVGRAPKLLRLYRCAPGMPYMQMKFDDGRPGVVDKKGKVKTKLALVEVLAGETKWFVAEGVHPDTKKPYQWLDPLPPREELTFVTPEDIERCMARLARELPKATRPKKSSGPRTAEQEALKGDPDLVARAMRHIPNDPEFVGYDEWVRIGVALNGALPDHHALGLELFEEYTDKADIAEPTDTAARVYDSFDDDKIRLGAPYIYDLAQLNGWDGKGRPAQWFEANPEVEPDLPEPMFPYGGEEPQAQIRLEPLQPFDVRAIPPRDFLYGAHYVRSFVSMTSAPSKMGKSSVTTVEVLAMVTGRNLLGVQPKAPLTVWYFNGEDPMEELLRRFGAAMQHYGITWEDIGGRLIISTGRTMPVVVARETRNGVEIVQPVVAQLAGEFARLGVDVAVLDPFVATHQVSENNNTAMEAVVTEWMHLAEGSGCAIELVHHTRKGSGSAGGAGDDEVSALDSARGASAIGAKMRSARGYVGMTRKQGEAVGLSMTYRSYFRVADVRSNLAAWVDDETRWFHLVSVDLGNGPDEDAERWLKGDHIAVVTIWTAGERSVVESDDSERILEAVRGGEWRQSPKSEEWVGKAVAMALALDIDDVDDRKRVSLIIKKMLREGLLRVVQRKDKKYQNRMYVEAIDVFD